MNEKSKTWQLVNTLYKDEAGDPIDLTPGQLEIFEEIAQKKHPRVFISCHTRFGKSLDAGLAVLTRASTYPEKWAIVAGEKEKAKIIMNYINAHIFDNAYTAQRFRHKKGEEEEIKRYRNKNHLTFDIGNGTIGEVFISSAKDALGFGAPNVVEDEAALIDNENHALVMRMLGDKPDNFLAKIGNPFNRNHFLDSFNSDRYYKVIIDCYRGLQEGRIPSQDFLDEQREASPRLFKILYECKFPGAEEIDSEGWMNLLTDEDIRVAMARNVEQFGLKKLGVDVARGGRNYNVIVLRGENYARIIRKDQEPDLMETAKNVIKAMADAGVKEEEVYIDDVGVGGGVVDRIREHGYKKINAVRAGDPAEDTTKYINIRAEMYAGEYGLYNWIKRTGYLQPDDGWMEITRIRFKQDSGRRTKLESKDDMRSRGAESPDISDALALTFARKASKRFFVPKQVFTVPEVQGVLDGDLNYGI